MKRKLILFSLIAALLCGIFAFAVLAADNDSTDAAEPAESETAEKKKLSEFTDEELKSYLSDKDITFMKIPYDVNPMFESEEQLLQTARGMIAEFENDINDMLTIDAGFTAWYVIEEELRLVVEEYYEIKSNIVSDPLTELTRKSYRDAYGIK